ncbi:MAG: choice-of-anchor D domain-containing protein [Myxococcales bacterium]|nr:MAG: choice-of-anchor D domain-containing protein [Myxococcales bacterium]
MRRRFPWLVMFTLLAGSILIAGCGGGGGDESSDGDRPDQTDGDKADGDLDEDTDRDRLDGDREREEESERDVIDEDGDEPDGDEDEDLPESGNLELSPARLDCGDLAAGAETTVPFTLKNGGEPDAADLTLTSIEFGRNSSPNLAVADGCETPFTLEPGSEKDCAVACSGDAPGPIAGLLRAVARDEATDAGLEARADVVGDVNAGIAHIDPVRVEFGAVELGRSDYHELTLTNVGSATLAVESIALADSSDVAFDLRLPEDLELPAAIAPNDGFVFEVGFTPRADAQALGWLVLTSDDLQQPESGRRIALTGRAVEACPAGQQEDGKSCVDVCLPGEFACAGEAAFHVCKADGSGWETETPVACGAGQRCARGVCVFMECMDGTQACLNGAAAACAGEEGRFERSQACDEAGECEISLCRPGVGCQVENDRRRCEDGNPCTTDTCLDDANCRHEFNSLSCNDLDRCTENDVCSFGVCRGPAVGCDDGNACTIDSCLPQTGCRHEPGGFGCSDGNACTTSDRCENGECIGTAAIVCDDLNPCTMDTCGPAGGCIFAPTQTACDDGNPCTIDDVCGAGLCGGRQGTVSDGVFCNGDEVCDPEQGLVTIGPRICHDAFACTLDGCDETAKACVFEPDDERCDDGNPCTTDACQPGQGCVNVALPDFSDCLLIGLDSEACIDGQCAIPCAGDLECQDGVECTYDYCDQTIGYCRHDPLDEQCDDGLFCDGVELCSLRFGCIPGEVVDCEDGQFCTTGRCDEETDACVYETDNQACNDYNACTVDVCRPGQGCLHLPKPGSCDDLNPCTINDYCAAGFCLPGSARNTCADGNPCTDDRCLQGEGCANLPNAADCDDGDPCTNYDACDEGLCAGVERLCDDGEFCNGAETCDGQGCAAGEPPDCDDGVACTIDWCDEEGRACVNDPDDSLCDDRNPCTLDDSCEAGGCVYAEVADEGTVCGQTALGNKECHDGLCVARCAENGDCDDEVACTEDACNQETGFCVHFANDGLCDDPYWCNGQSVCHPTLGCQENQPVNCDDGSVCTVDSCDNNEQMCIHTRDDALCDDGNPCATGMCTASGCVFAPLAGACDDGDPCTTGDECLSKICQGQPIDCDDDNFCTVEFCLPAQGCASQPLADGTPCGSGGIGRLCRGGQCAEGCLSDAECDDEVACTVDWCDPATHQCQSEVSNAYCDDGRFCNGVEHCDAEQGCQPGQPIQCSDGLSCTRDFCDEPLHGCRFAVDPAVCDDGDRCTDDFCFASGCEHEPNTAPCDDGNACTTNDRCDQGACSGAARVCNDADACTEDGCDPLSGCYARNIKAECTTDNPCMKAVCLSDAGCIEQPIEGECEDGNACTVADHCGNGQCASGRARDCDDRDPCTTDTCDPVDGCAHAAKPEGAQCNVGGANLNGECHGGLCVRTCISASNCDDGAPCTTDTCNVVSGLCEHQVNHVVCSDGLFCTGEERCMPDLGCVRAGPRDCSDGVDCTTDSCNEQQDRCDHAAVNGACDDGNLCTSDSCNLATGCQHLPDNGKACDDGDRCTTGDACQNGVCQSSGSLACDDGNDCTGPDSCDPAIGCVNPPLADGASCDEGETCMFGRCGETCADAADCDDGVACTADICDFSVGRCRHFAGNAACDDGQYCNGEEVCHPSFGCREGIPVVCDDGVDCTLDRCDENDRICVNSPTDVVCHDGNSCTEEHCDRALGCTYTKNDGAACEDGNLCTVGDACREGVCWPGNSRQCGDPTSCLAAACDPRFGCYNVQINGECQSNLECTLFSSCVAGACVGRIYRGCNDYNACTNDACDAVGGCGSSPNDGGACDDGNDCTAGDQCFSRSCEGAEIDCDDTNPCTADACEASGGCQHEPLADGTSCSPPSGQVTSECVNGACLCMEAAECDDGVACTLDECADGACAHTPQNNLCGAGKVCDPEDGCVAAGCRTDADCGDDDACNGRETCDNGVCRAGQTLNCDDGNVCTGDSCHAVQGCLHTANDNAACNDGSACTSGDYCRAGFCIGGTKVLCRDMNPCTDDACDLVLGCRFPPKQNGVLCNDGDPCTIGDACQAGLCVSAAVDCNDDNPCTYDACDGRGACENRPLTGSSCDDGNGCTTESVCIDGSCAAKTRRNCDDGDPCTRDTCEAALGCRHNDICP